MTWIPLYKGTAQTAVKKVALGYHEKEPKYKYVKLNQISFHKAIMNNNQ